MKIASGLIYSENHIFYNIWKEKRNCPSFQESLHCDFIIEKLKWEYWTLEF